MQACALGSQAPLARGGSLPPVADCHPSAAPYAAAGMRGAFGKPFGVCARVAIGQILLSIRCKDNHGVIAEEALRRAKFKFPGRQKIVASRNWWVAGLWLVGWCTVNSPPPLPPENVAGSTRRCCGCQEGRAHDMLCGFWPQHICCAKAACFTRAASLSASLSALLSAVGPHRHLGSAPFP